MNTVAAWRAPPPLADLLSAAQHSRDLVVCLPDKSLPEWVVSRRPCPTEQTLHRVLSNPASCIQFGGANRFEGLIPDAVLWLMPPESANRLHDYFNRPVSWLDTPLPQQPPATVKPWLSDPEPQRPEHALVIGAGIAGAATAYELARRGIGVTVLETAARPAAAASGNRQGLLYAKISPHFTEQTELLLCGYSHTRRLLTQLLPDRAEWGGYGVLHLNHDEDERRRNTALARHEWHQHLYRGVSAAEATNIAGIPVTQDALYWPQGVWLHPAGLVRALLDQPGISLLTASPLRSVHHDGKQWHAQTPHGTFSGSHIIFCTGADSPGVPLIREFPFQLIRGQTAVAEATAVSLRLRAALSGASYITPAWEGRHCYGASFIPHDNGRDWRTGEDADNRRAVAELSTYLHHNLPEQAVGGHAAVRCDSYDHLPAVGPLGDAAAMQRVYAKLAADKNYRLRDACPYLPQAYTNTAHGSRGLATAPLAAADLVARLCGEPPLLSARLHAALHPNRLIIRKITHSQNNRTNAQDNLNHLSSFKSR